jgi:hypothetical protein
MVSRAPGQESDAGRLARELAAPALDCPLEVA